MSQQQKRFISVFLLAMINVAAICNIANLPFAAKYGLSSFFFYALTTLLFFIPSALVSAELSSAWPQEGGVYAWVKNALGDRWGFLAIFLQWIENVIWYPASLAFLASAIAFIFFPHLAESKTYIISTVLIIFWGVTLINFLGMKVSGMISSFCAMLGTIFPGAMIILLGILWLVLGKPTQVDISFSALIPSVSSLGNFAYIAGILLSLQGIEMSAVHAQDVLNPQKSYSRAILFSGLIIFVIMSFGALSIAIVVPQDKILFSSGALEALKGFLDAFHMSWAIPILAACISIGTLGLISTWTVGPTKGLLATRKYGDLPPLLQKTNKKDMPVAILLLQAILVTILSVVFLLVPSVSSAYRLFITLSAQLYLIMYILMFISAIVLRYKYPDKKREFSIPGKKFGLWLICLSGILTSLFGLFCGYLPPDDLAKEHTLFVELFLLGTGAIFILFPLLLQKYKKPHWVHKQ